VELGWEGKDYRSLIETVCFKSRTRRFLARGAVAENSSGRSSRKRVFDGPTEIGAVSEVEIVFFVEDF
jgi:hypothetical protein